MRGWKENNALCYFCREYNMFFKKYYQSYDTNHYWLPCDVLFINCINKKCPLHIQIIPDEIITLHLKLLYEEKIKYLSAFAF